MNQPQTPCPQCGTESEWIRNDAGPGRCANCGFPRLPLEYRQLPRPSSFYTPTHWTSLVFMIILSPVFALLGGLMVFAPVTSFASAFQTLRDGVVTTKGRITHVKAIRGEKTSIVSMEFLIANKGIFSQIKTSGFVITPFLVGTLKSGQVIDIIVPVSDPKAAIIRNDLPGWLATSALCLYLLGIFLLFGIPILIIALMIPPLMILETFRLCRFHAHGQLTQAIIIDKWEIVYTVDEDNLERTKKFTAYAYKVGASEQIYSTGECASDLFSSLQLSQCRIGDAITVRYLPSNPMISIAQRS